MDKCDHELKIPINKLCLCAWDDTLPAIAGPTSIQAFFCDEEGYYYCLTPNAQFGYAYDFKDGCCLHTTTDNKIELKKMIAKSTGHGTFVNLDKHKISCTGYDTILQIPVIKGLPESSLEILEIPYIDVETINPLKVIRIVYPQNKKQHTLIMSQIIAHIYLSACTYLISGSSDDKITALNLLTHIIGRGELPQSKLLAAKLYTEVYFNENRMDFLLFLLSPIAEEMGLLAKHNKKMSNDVINELMDIAEKLLKREIGERANKPTEASESIAEWIKQNIHSYENFIPKPGQLHCPLRNWLTEKR